MLTRRTLLAGFPLVAVPLLLAEDKGRASEWITVCDSQPAAFSQRSYGAALATMCAQAKGKYVTDTVDIDQPDGTALNAIKGVVSDARLTDEGTFQVCIKWFGGKNPEPFLYVLPAGSAFLPRDETGNILTEVPAEYTLSHFHLHPYKTFALSTPIGV